MAVKRPSKGAYTSIKQVFTAADLGHCYGCESTPEFCGMGVYNNVPRQGYPQLLEITLNLAVANR